MDTETQPVGWKVGDSFTIPNGTKVYTINADPDIPGRMNVTWPGADLSPVHYSIGDLNQCFRIYNWVIVDSKSEAEGGPEPVGWKFGDKFRTPTERTFTLERHPTDNTKVITRSPEDGSAGTHDISWVNTRFSNTDRYGKWTLIETERVPAVGDKIIVTSVPVLGDRATPRVRKNDDGTSTVVKVLDDSEGINNGKPRVYAKAASARAEEADQEWYVNWEWPKETGMTDTVTNTDTETTVEWEPGDLFRMEGNLKPFRVVNGNPERFNVEYKDIGSDEWRLYSASYRRAEISAHFNGEYGAKWTKITNEPNVNPWKPEAGGIVRVVRVPGFAGSSDKGLSRVEHTNGLAVVGEIDGMYDGSPRVYVRRSDDGWGQSLYVDYEQPKVRVGDVVKVTAVPPWEGDPDKGLSRVEHTNGLAVVVGVGTPEVSERVEVRASSNAYADGRMSTYADSRVFVDWEWPTGDELDGFTEPNTETITEEPTSEALKLQLSQALTALDEERRTTATAVQQALDIERTRIIESLDEEAARRAWCGEYNEWLQEIGLAAYSNREQDYTFHVRASFDVTISTTDPSSVTRQDIFDVWEQQPYDIDTFDVD